MVNNRVYRLYNEQFIINIILTSFIYLFVDLAFFLKFRISIFSKDMLIVGISSIFVAVPSLFIKPSGKVFYAVCNALFWISLMHFPLFDQYSLFVNGIILSLPFIFVFGFMYAFLYYELYKRKVSVYFAYFYSLLIFAIVYLVLRCIRF